MRFVSFDHSSGVLRMLVLGECGMCRALHIRNICNMTYAQDCLVPIITLLFSMVKRIDIVRSDDADLSELVEREGGEVTTPYSADLPLSFEDINRFFLDQHPEIDGHVKALSPLLPNQRSNVGERITRRTFTNSNNLCWSVMDSSSVVGRDGRLVAGVDDILSNADNLPLGVELVQDGSRLCVMMCLTGIFNFRAEIYKKIVF